MDIRCPKCGEPTGMDSLHEETEERIRAGVTAEYQDVYAVVLKDFSANGCPALTVYGAKCSETKADPVYAALFDMLGDDVDGIACMMEDYDLFYGEGDED